MTGHSAPPRDAGPAPILAARLARAYPNLPPHCAARLAEAFVRIGKAQHTHAERWCNDANYDVDRAAARIAGRVRNARHWAAEWIGEELPVPNVYLEGDPRGTVLRIWLPGDEPATDSQPAQGVV